AAAVLVAEAAHARVAARAGVAGVALVALEVGQLRAAGAAFEAERGNRRGECERALHGEAAPLEEGELFIPGSGRVKMNITPPAIAPTPPRPQSTLAVEPSPLAALTRLRALV